MEEMKIRLCLILPLLLILCLSSCASAPAVDSGTSSGTQDIHNNHKEKKQNSKKLLFENWKYKGFGKELPVWFEAAYNANEAKLKNLVPELKEKQVLILRGDGVNSDQSDKTLKLKIAEEAADFQLYDSSWAMIQAGNYVSLAILYKEN